MHWRLAAEIYYTSATKGVCVQLPVAPLSAGHEASMQLICCVLRTYPWFGPGDNPNAEMCFQPNQKQLKDIPVTTHLHRGVQLSSDEEVVVRREALRQSHCVCAILRLLQPEFQSVVPFVE